MNHNTLQRILALLLSAALLCTSCGQLKNTQDTIADLTKTEGNSLVEAIVNGIKSEGDRLKATTMSLTKTEGTVNISTGEGKTIPPTDGLKLYSGYGMRTQAVSYAWMNLDRVKLTKMDESSEIDIQKKNNDLEIYIHSGALFFNITEPLDDNETMNIRTSSMLVGIRGTCGWVNAVSDTHTQVYILEGQVSAAGEDRQNEVFVSAGEMAEIVVTEAGDTEITVSDFSVSAIPGFIMTELEQDETLAQAILEAAGLDVVNPPSDAELAVEAYDRVLEEYQALPYVDYWSGLWENINWSDYRYITDDLYYFDSDDAGYAYYDVNGDGVDELFVGFYQGYRFGFGWSSLYTFNGTDAVRLITQPDEGSYEILADGIILYYSNGGMIDGIYQLNADTFALEPVTDSDIVAYDWEDESTWRPSSLEPQELLSHGGALEPRLNWLPLDGIGDFILTEEIDFGSYVGSYSNNETGISLDLVFDGTRYTMYTPRPGDPAHADSFSLRATDKNFELNDWQSGSLLLTLTPRNGELIVKSTGAEESLNYLNGSYRRVSTAGR